ncbi:sensor histidine kinase [Streptomyces gilvosporeus]|uniref:histidine kinase n=1 Tax=Streptomyces gilvosporeus TaxID=553510 RepID=A0A1V0TMN1_9ACTN|nr:nitrate- and nitrite sensing domain-containing protein [Streptomyces gilvosporeus]ARF54110.1 histidine kinase [Streptomyces gilvosporeus]
MRFRGKSIRRKIVALLLVPLVSLTAMWTFATYLTGREANQLLEVANVMQRVGYPAEGVVQALQRERRQSLLYLADRRGADALPRLRQEERATDRAVVRLKGNAHDPEVLDEIHGAVAGRAQSVVKSLAGLSDLRKQVEDNTVSSDEALEAYDSMVDPTYDFLASLNSLDSVELDEQARALVQITRAREAFSREDALMSAALSSGSMTRHDLRMFADRIAERRILYGTNLTLLPFRDRGIYEDYWRSARAREVTSYEEAALAAGARRAPQAVNAERWNAAADKVLDDLTRMGKDAGDRYQRRVEPYATRVVLKAAVAGVLGFVALLVSVIVSLRIGSRHVKDLTRLRKAAHEVSGVRLPSVMRRLAAGEQVDVETEAPRLEFGPDETGQVGQALNTLQRAAVEAAVKQADMRRGVSEVFVNLARRSQVLLHRQLTLLDAMERRTEDTDELADLFRLDHLTTRMRRHAEGLVILSGAAPARQWRKPIQLMDVVRAAVAEVEDYERIEVRRLPRLAVDGPAVSDLTHLIAELLENATVFSPPHTAVQVLGDRVSNGFTLEIHDRGLGMAPDVLLDCNLRLAETAEFELSDTDRLGLFVVSRLARRHGVRVGLQTSPYGGTTAVVFIPGAILTEASEGGREDTGALGPADGGGNELEHAAGKLAALSQGAKALPKGRTPRVVDGPVELEAPLGLDELGPLDDDPDSVFRGRERGRERDGGRDREHDRDRRGPAARPTGPTASPAAPPGIAAVPDGEQHQQTRDQAPGGLTPLPRRRKPPVLVSDHGRTVDGASAHGGDTHGDDAHADDTRGGETHQSRTRGSEARGGEKRPGPDGEATAGDTPGAPDAPARPAPGGLPRRVRQASLAPQLKQAPEPQDAPHPAEEPDDDRDAEAVRARMASLQRGWQRGRRDAEDLTADAAPADRPGAGAPAGDENAHRTRTGRDPAARDGDDGGGTAAGNTTGGDGP